MTMTDAIPVGMIKTEQLVNANNFFYADQLAQLAVGPHVSKLTFGNDISFGAMPEPVVTIAIPTQSLINLIRQASDVLNDPATQSGMHAELSKYLSNFQAKK